MKASNKAVFLPVVLLILWVGVLAWLSLTATPPRLSGPLSWDKFLHAAAYAVLAWLLAWVLHCCRSAHALGAWWFAWLLAIFFGAGMEVLQMSMHAGRSAEWLDLAADGVGALVACVIFRQLMRST